ncbi:restriction endonuclease subunit S [Streptococcus sp. 202]|uniref:restriction endonuclease subunit S n=2 Tax=unclassified Streptococcus TaxID=2608887 RepID=UPI001565E80E|nr:restriction endonuclease subunit S [Streptococcus sp. 202]
MTIIFLQNIFEKSINGEWGNEDSGKGEATAVIRTSNFLNSGRLNLDNIVCREIDKDKNSDKILRTGDIIIEKSGGSPNQPVGRVVYFDVTDQDYFTNNFTSILRVKPGYNSKYIFYLMKYLYDTKKVLKFQNQTTGIINLKLADYLNKTKVNIETIENQNTIVDILDRLEYQIINRNKQLSELSNLVKSRFNEMFGDPLNNNKKFAVKTGQQCFKFSSGKFLDKHDRVFEGYPAYGGNGIAWKSRKYLIDNPTIIIGRVGAYCGNVRTTYGKVWISDNAIYIKEFKNSDFNLVFLLELMKVIDFSKFADFSGQPKITQKPLENQKYILPPLSLQNEFADFVAQVDKSQLAIQKSLEELETLKKSLMQEYFG